MFLLLMTSCFFLFVSLFYATYILLTMLEVDDTSILVMRYPGIEPMTSGTEIQDAYRQVVLLVYTTYFTERPERRANCRHALTIFKERLLLDFPIVPRGGAGVYYQNNSA